MEAQLARQAVWLRDSLLWVIDWKILAQWEGAGRPVALDVGCGPGHVMEIVGKVLDVTGVDTDHLSVEACSRRGLKAEVGAAENLPFDDSSFDVVYCSFLMLWLKDPVRVVQEMKRVSRGWIVCLAEPDLGGRIDHPEELSGLRDIAARGIQSEGDKKFDEWWRLQPTFITFDDWLAKEEEKRKEGPVPCPVCGTLNPKEATVCHKCGTVFGERKEEPPSRGAPPAAPESHSAELASAEAPQAELTQAQVAPAAAPKMVIRRPIDRKVVPKKIIKTPVGGTDEKSENGSGGDESQ
jgi:SAM-dependent methyltransferase